MNNPSRSNEIVTHIVVILFFIIATMVSAITALHGWVGFLFFPTYVIGGLIVLVTSIIVLVRDPFFRYKLLLIISSFIFMFSAFLVVGDNGDSTGSYYLGMEYGTEAGRELPFLPRYFSSLGYFLYFIFGILSMALMIMFASSKKRNTYLK